MQDILFLTRHIPFWGIPLIIMGAEFGYMFWLKKKKKQASICLTLVLIGTFSIGFYIWAGGPDKAVKIVKRLYIHHR